MIKRIIFTVSALALLLASSGIVTAEDTVTYNDNIKTVLQSNGCIGCHSFMGTYSGIIAQVSYDTLNGAKIVNTAVPDSSIILWRLAGKKPGGDFINLMPKGGSALPADTIALMRTWIEQGALEEAPVGVEETKNWLEIKKKFKEE